MKLCRCGIESSNHPLKWSAQTENLLAHVVVNIHKKQYNTSIEMSKNYTQIQLQGCVSRKIFNILRERRSALGLCFLQSLVLNFTQGASCCLLDHQQKYVGSVGTRSLLGLMNCLYPRCSVVTSNVTLSEQGDPAE